MKKRYIVVILFYYCCYDVTQIHERAGILVSPHAALITLVMDFAMSTSEMIITIGVHAM